MSHLALYRKYRSKTFDEIVGQKHVTETLKNQIMNDKVAHAYLFCGIRGIGKTSIAKILGKAVNCLNPVDGNPCLECEMCRDIDLGSNLNVIEIDAASNTSVEDIKKIRDDVVYTPAKGKYKVYIIDEVHMLSNSAFNALLKTLEEPPKHVIFILATTEVQKIPPTILSRCQRYDLKRISSQLMCNRIKDYLKNENILLLDDALEYIVALSEGAMRDALSILEQIVSISVDKTITLQDVLEVLGYVDYSVYDKFTQAIVKKDVSQSIIIVNEVYNDGKEIRGFVVEYIKYLRNVLLINNTSNTSKIIDMSEENIKKIKEMSFDIDSKTVIKFIEEFTKLENDMKYSNMPKLLLEVLLIKLCRIDNNEEMNIKSNKMHIENTDMIGTKVEKDIESDKTHMENTDIVENQKSTETKIEKDDAKDVIKEFNTESQMLSEWKNICQKQGMILSTLLNLTKASKVTDDAYYVLVRDEFTKKRLDEKYKEKLEEVLPTYKGKKLKLIFYIETDLIKKNKTSNIENNSINDVENKLASTGLNITIEGE